MTYIKPIKYLFAYGSLINSESRNYSISRRNGRPARLIGYKRGWFLQDPDEQVSGLGIIPFPDSACNGVLFEINNEDVSKLDTRELPHGYQRVCLDKAQLILLETGSAPETSFWAYLVSKAGIPDSECPIIQSYLDVVIAGCLEIGQEFAEEFINTTFSWEGKWINDRIEPRYQRAMGGSISASKIDSILQKNVPEAMQHRREI